MILERTIYIYIYWLNEYYFLPNIFISYIESRLLHLANMTDSDVSFEAHNNSTINGCHHCNLYKRKQNGDHSGISHFSKPLPLLW